VKGAHGRAAIAKPRKSRGKARPSSSAPGTFTPEKRAAFLEHYRTGVTVRAAAAFVGVSHVTVFNHIRKDELFAEQYRSAMETNTDTLEDDLHTLACNGNVAALFGTLKARRPERWRERVDVSNQDGTLLKPLAEAIRRAHGIGVGVAQTQQADEAGEARAH
jgi:hypothetical protein